MEIFIIFSIIIQVVVGDFQPCITEEKIVCRCSSLIGLCNNKQMNEFPIFATQLRSTIKEIHASGNFISSWPNETIWISYQNLVYVDVMNNPLCHLPKTTKKLQIDISPCKCFILHIFFNRRPFCFRVL